MSPSDGKDGGSDGLPPVELVVDARPAPGDSNDGSGSQMGPIVLSVMGAGFLAKFVSPTVGIAAFAAASALMIARRKPREGRFVLRVADGVVEVKRERRPEPVERIALADILGVTLDRENRQASGRGGIATERVKLSLVRREPATPLLLPDERITPLEGQEWQGKVRVFLRKHGWLPEDER